MADNEKTEDKKENFFLNVRKSWWVYLVFVVLAWVISWIGTDFFINKSSDRGTFGDKFGAVNALFSGLAFAGVIITILLQREELKATRDAVKTQTAEFELQNKTLALQRFEHSFFSMLSQHNEFIKLLGDDKKKGVGYFIELFKEEIQKGNTADISNIYANKYNGIRQLNLESYFSSIDLLILAINKANVENKEIYYDLIATRLTFNEKCLLCLEVGRNTEGVVLKLFLLGRRIAPYLSGIISKDNNFKNREAWLKYLQDIQKN